MATSQYLTLNPTCDIADCLICWLQKCHHDMFCSLVMHAILVTVLTGLINIIQMLFNMYARITNITPKAKSLTIGGDEAIICLLLWNKFVFNFSYCWLGVNALGMWGIQEVYSKPSGVKKGNSTHQKYKLPYNILFSLPASNFTAQCGVFFVHDAGSSQTSVLFENIVYTKVCIVYMSEV